MFSSEWGIEGQVDGDLKMKWGAIMLGKGYVFFLLFFYPVDSVGFVFDMY
jgi:hypothetical protein